MTARVAGSAKNMGGNRVTNLGTPTPATSDAARISDVEAAQAAAVSRANHTGTQTASTISNFDAQVRTNRLDQMAAPTAALSINAQKLSSVADPTVDTDAATRGWVNAQIAALTTGMVLKGSVRAASSANINTAAPGATIDGVTPTTGDIFLLSAQSTGSQNGPWVWNGAASAMTRPPNWDVQGEAVIGSYWVVTGGSYKPDTLALMTNDTFTLGTTTAAFKFIDLAAGGSTAPVEQDLGNASAVTFTITHNFGTRAVNVVVYRSATPWDEIDVYVDRPDVNSVRIQPDSVWAANEFHAVVSKM